MSVADKLNTLTSNINSAYASISAKGGTIPEHKNTQNIATAVNTIPVYAPKTLAYISYGDATTAQSFVNLMAAQPNSPLGGASYAFADTEGLTTLDLSALDFSAVTDTVCMFNEADDLTTITWSNPVDMGNVETMEGMYRGTSSLTSVDLSKFATGEYLESVFNMFASSGVQSVDLGAPFDTSAVTDFYGMFNSCSALTSLGHINNLRMDSAANVGAMFYNCSALTNLDLGEGNRGSNSYQLLTKQGLSTDPSDSAFWSAITSNRVTITPQGNGWLHVKQDVSGFGNFNTSPTSIHNFSGNTTYTIIVELKNVENASGIIGLIQTAHADESFGSFTVVQGASGTTEGRAWIDLANPDPITVLVATTKTSISNRGLRFHNRDNVGVGTEYDIRCTVIEGDHSADWQNYSWEPYAFTAPSLSLSTANADYMLAGMTNLQSLNLSGWKSGSDDLATSNFWTTQSALTTLTLNGPKRLASGKLADSLVATFNSKQGSTVTTLKLNNPEFFTTDGTAATLTDFSDVWAGSALTTLEMTGWDVSGVDPTDSSSSTTLTSVANLTTLTIGNWTTPTNGVNLATLLGVDNNGSNGYTGSATVLANLHITGSSVLKVYDSGTGEFKSSNAFAGCPIGNGTGHIYVPSSLVNSYKADSFWSAYASIITAES